MKNTSRREQIQHWLRQLELGAILFWRADELVMSVGFQPHWNTSLCLYPVEGAPIVYVPSNEPDPSFREHVTVRTYTDANGDLIDRISADLNETSSSEPNGIPRSGSRNAPGVISAETSLFSEGISERLMDAIDETIDVSEEVKTLYHRKTPAEIERIRRANEVAGAGLKSFYEHLSPGCTEADVASAVERAVRNYTGREGINHARAWAFVQSGPNTIDGGVYNRTSGRELAEGEMVMVELATCVDGFWSDLTRTGAVGQPEEPRKRAFEIVRRAQRAALKKLEPGIPTGEVDRAARSVVEEEGMGDWFPHATGHQTGFRYHDPGPVLDRGGEDPLEPGMVVTVEPGVYSSELGTGIRVEDNVVVTENNFERLSSAPRTLSGAPDEPGTSE